MDILLLTAVLSVQRGLEMWSVLAILRQNGRPCHMLGFLPFVLIPEYFS